LKNRAGRQKEKPQGDKERCLPVGMDGYVPKPVKLEELFSVIEKAIPGINRDSDAKIPL
jgi:CheY-like chemotaxis protein